MRDRQCVPHFLNSRRLVPLKKIGEARPSGLKIRSGSQKCLDHVCSVTYIQHIMEFGEHLRYVRERLRQEDRRYSLRQVAKRIGVEPAYLSKIERGEAAPPSEATTVKLAKELGEDPDVLLAMAGKVSSDLQAIIRKRPELFSELIRQLKEAPDHAVLKLVREVRDGDW